MGKKSDLVLRDMNPGNLYTGGNPGLRKGPGLFPARNMVLEKFSVSLYFFGGMHCFPIFYLTNSGILVK